MTNLHTDFTEVIYHQPGHLRGVNVLREINGYIFSGGQDGRICIWDTNLNQGLGCIYAHNAPIIDIQKIETKNRIITAAQELELRIWSMENLSLVLSKKVHISSLSSAKPWLEFIITSGRDQELKKWKTKDDSLVVESKIKIPEMDKVYMSEDKIIISCLDGEKIVFQAQDFTKIKSLFINDSKVIRAIRKATKYISAFKGKDPYTLLFNFSRRNGFSITTAYTTSHYLILGHEFGLVSLWHKKTLKLDKAFFLHGKHVTGIESDGEFLYTISLDSTVVKYSIKEEKIVKRKILSSKPFTLLKNSNDNLIIGFDNGELLVLDSNLDLIKTIPKIIQITGATITPDSLAFASNSGQIVLLDNKNLEFKRKAQIHNKGILGIFYYNNNIISVGDDGKIVILDTFLETVKELKFDQKITQIRRVKHYISLTPNHVIDLRKYEIIKGEISDETKEELKQIEIINFNLVKGDISIIINNIILENDIPKEIEEYYSKEIIESLVKLSKANKKSFYKRQSIYSVISEKLIK